MSFTQNAYDVLRENLSDIATVQEWAHQMDYSRTHFRLKIKREVNMNPSKLLRQANKERLSMLISQQPKIKAITMAHAIGFSSVQGLYQYLKTHYNCSITQFRKKALKKSSN